MRLSDDLLCGIKQIADHIGLDEKKTFNMHKRGLLPTFKKGHAVFARKTALDACFNAG